MKKLLLAFLLGNSLFAARAQSYYAVRINETMYVNNKELRPKDKVDKSATIRFSSPTAYAYVISPDNGNYYYIAVKKNAKQKKGELSRALAEAIIPPSDYNDAATRAMQPYESAAFKDQYELKTYFQGRLFFIDTARFEVPAKYFPLDSSRYFAIKHYTEKGSFVNKLSQVGQTFELHAKSLERNDKIPPITISELYYIDKITGKEKSLGKFNLRFLTPEATQTMLEELQTIYNVNNKMILEQFVKNRALPYLALFYGKTQESAILNLVKIHFK